MIADLVKSAKKICEGESKRERLSLECPASIFREQRANLFSCNKNEAVPAARLISKNHGEADKTVSTSLSFLLGLPISLFPFRWTSSPLLFPSSKSSHFLLLPPSLSLNRRRERGTPIERIKGFSSAAGDEAGCNKSLIYKPTLDLGLVNEGGGCAAIFT